VSSATLVNPSCVAVTTMRTWVVDTAEANGIQRSSEELPLTVASVTHCAPSQACTVKSVGTPSEIEANPTPCSVTAEGVVTVSVSGYWFWVSSFQNVATFPSIAFDAR